MMINMISRIKELEARLEKLEKENKEFKELKQETNKAKERFKAQENGIYFLVDAYGRVVKDLNYSVFDDKRFKKGNYFETEELAKKSLIYFAFNDPYEYWSPWMGEDTKPSESPDGLQYWHNNYWHNSGAIPESWIKLSYRWPKHPNMDKSLIARIYK